MPPRSPATQYPPSANKLANPDVQRVLHTRSQIIQFVPPKQPKQFHSHSSSAADKSAATISGNDASRQHHPTALNGGPPGGGAVINSRTGKKQQASNASNYKFQVHAKESPIAQSQPKRGGQLMTF
jgi:hypothetical protein